MIELQLKGSFNETDRFLSRMAKLDISDLLSQYGQLGVEALSSATPVDSGKTAQSWTYEVKRTRGSVRIIWENTHIVKGVPIAIILQYGHGTGTGGYVQGRDYINPAIRPIFDKLSKEVERLIHG